MNNTEEDLHCCSTMRHYIYEEKGIIEYELNIKSYVFLYSDNQFDWQLPLLYCPWCGTKLPERLIHKMEQVLEEEYGITEKDWGNKEKIPPEFNTDEWWKKRGL